MDYFHPLSDAEAPNFRGSTLILPQPSLASLAQLASDLLVHTHAWRLVGHLGLRDFIPVVYVPEGTQAGSLGLAVQGSFAPLGRWAYSDFWRTVFQSQDGQRTLVLPRTPVIKARKADYLASMAKFVGAAGFSRVLVVASVDASTRTEEGLDSCALPFDPQKVGTLTRGGVGRRHSVLSLHPLSFPNSPLSQLTPANSFPLPVQHDSFSPPFLPRSRPLC
jgi:hypothetical protein